MRSAGVIDHNIYCLIIKHLGINIIKLIHDRKPGKIVFPNHGSQEIGKGLEMKTLKDAGINKNN